MSTKTYVESMGSVSHKKTPQNEPIPGTTQVQNDAGGYTWEVDEWTDLDRFLILGTEGGTYYAGERALTRESLLNVSRCLDLDGIRAVNRIIEISDAGRAPKNTPAIAALAMATAHNDLDTRKYALENLSKVCRIGTHLFQFAKTVSKLRGWGRALSRGVANWYQEKSADKLAYQAVKYQQREGWSHRDLLRLTHPTPLDADHNLLYAWIVDSKDLIKEDFEGWPESLKLVEGFELAKTAATKKEIISLINEYGLEREMIPTEFLKEPEVWEALLPNLKLTAIMRNLANITRIGFLTPSSDVERTIRAKLTDPDLLKTSRVHPMNILIALLTYQAGQGLRGKNAWTPVARITEALNDAFYASFPNVEPTNKNILIGIDVSGSMGWPDLLDVPGLTPCMCAAAMSLVTANTEPNYEIMGFAHTFRSLGIHKGMSLNEALKRAHDNNFGRTNCSLPMQWAMKNNSKFDAFMVLTDNETWYGDIHPAQALQQYRNQTSIPAKLIVEAFAVNNFSIADPNDRGMMDVVGFDTAVPAIIHDFLMQA